MTSPGTVEPTDSERQQADAIVSRWTYKGEAFTNRAIEHIAQALADQRARYEAVADELETKLVLGAGRTAAERIRQVSR